MIFGFSLDRPCQTPTLCYNQKRPSSTTLLLEPNLELEVNSERWITDCKLFSVRHQFTQFASEIGPSLLFQAGWTGIVQRFLLCSDRGLFELPDQTVSNAPTSRSSTRDRLTLQAVRQGVQ